MHGGAHTFSDFILRVAERAGLAFRPDSTTDNRARIPLDPHDLDRIKRAINDGRQTMYNRIAPCEAMRPRLEFTLDPAGTVDSVGGDPATIRLPWYVVGGPCDNPAWRSADNGMHGVCMVRDEAFIDGLYAHQPDTSGQPRYMAVFEPFEDGAGGGDQAPGWYLRVWPRPDAVYVLCASFPIQFAPMTADTQVEPLGPLFGEAVIWHAMEVLQARHPDLATRDWYERKARMSAEEALDRHLKAQPRNLGAPRFTGRRGAGRTESRENFLLASYNGVPNT